MSALVLAVVLVLQPAAPPAPAVPPRRLIAGSISNADYPVAAMRADAEGTTVVDLQIARDGRITACAIATSAGNAALDETTCTILTQRFRFNAVEADVPAQSQRRMRFNWQLPAPATPPVPFAAARLTVETLFPRGNGAAYCHRTVEGQPPEAMQSQVCAPNAVAPVAPRGVRERMLYVITLIPDGERLRPAARLSGPQRDEEHLRLDVDSRGVVTRCIASPNSQPPGGPSMTRARCDALMQGGRAVFLPNPSRPVRHGEIIAETQFELP